MKRDILIRNQSEIYKNPFLKFLFNIASSFFWGISVGVIVISTLIGLFLLLRTVGGHSLIDSLNVLNSGYAVLGTQMLKGFFIQASIFITGFVFIRKLNRVGLITSLPWIFSIGLWTVSLAMGHASLFGILVFGVLIFGIGFPILCLVILLWLTDEKTCL